MYCWQLQQARFRRLHTRPRVPALSLWCHECPRGRDRGAVRPSLAMPAALLRGGARSAWRRRGARRRGARLDRFQSAFSAAPCSTGGRGLRLQAALADVVAAKPKRCRAVFSAEPGWVAIAATWGPPQRVCLETAPFGLSVRVDSTVRADGFQLSRARLARGRAARARSVRRALAAGAPAPRPRPGRGEEAPFRAVDRWTDARSVSFRVPLCLAEGRDRGWVAMFFCFGKSFFFSGAVPFSLRLGGRPTTRGSTR